MLLPESEQSAGNDDGEDDESVCRVLEKQRKNGRTDQDQDDRTLELRE